MGKSLSNLNQKLVESHDFDAEVYSSYLSTQIWNEGHFDVSIYFWQIQHKIS